MKLEGVFFGKKKEWTLQKKAILVKLKWLFK